MNKIINKINNNIIKLEKKIESVNYIHQNFNFNQKDLFQYKYLNNYARNLCFTDEQKYQLDKEKFINECFKQINNDKLFYFVGDSHALHLLPMFVLFLFLLALLNMGVF